MEFGVVSVPEVGTWEMSLHSSKFSIDKTTLSPPQSFVNFSKFENDKFLFSKLLVESGLDASTAHSMESWFVQDYKLAQESTKVFSLQGLGKLVNNTFLVEDERIFDKYAGLNSLSAKFIPPKKLNIQHDDDYLFRLNNPYKEEKSPRSLFYLWPLLAALLVLGFVVFWWLSPKSSVPVPTQTTIVTDVVDSLEYESEINEEPNTIIEGNNVEEIQTTQETIITQTIADIPPITKGTINDNNTKSHSKECILIVGAFQSSDNVSRMVKKLKKLGYQYHTSKHNGLERVGIVYDCVANDPDVFKTKMRKKLEAQAWNLHDTL